MTKEEIKQKMQDIYCLWLRDNLNHYEFISDKAKQLKDKMININPDNEVELDLLKSLYLDFFCVFENNPFITFNGLKSTKEQDIICYSYDYYFVNNGYGVPVPIQFMKEYNLPVVDDILGKREKAILSISDIKKKLISQKSYANYNDYDVPDKWYKPSLILLIVASLLTIIGLTFALINVKPLYENRSYLSLGIASICTVGFLYFMVHLILEIIYYKKWQKEFKCGYNWNEDLEPTDTIMSLIDQQTQQLQAYLISLKTDNTGFFQLLHPDENLGDQANMDQKPPKPFVKRRPYFRKIRSMAGLLILVVIAFFVNGDKLTPAMGSVGQETIRIQVVAPNANLRKSAEMGDNVLAIVKRGQEATMIEKANDVSTDSAWYYVRFENGNKGWLHENVLKIINEYQIKYKKVKASSSISKSYGAANAADDFAKTCWEEGAKGYGKGEYLFFTFEQSTKVNTVTIINGNADSKKRYMENNRLKTAQLIFDDGTTIDLSFEDKYSQRPVGFVLDKPVQATKAKLVIKSVYKGSKYNETCISNVAMFR